MNFLEERIAKDEGSAATARFRYSGGNGGRFGDGYPAEKAEKITTNYITKTKFALRASEVICDSEVHFVSEVSLCGEVMANLTSL